MAKTSLIGLTLPATGTLSGQWGDTVNNAISQIVDVAVAGTQTITVDTDIDLAVTEGTYASTGLTANSSQYAVILCTGVRTALRFINTPKQSKTYVVINNTTGGYGVTVRGGPTSPTTGVTVAAGTRAIIAWDGSASVLDFVNVGGGSAGGSTTQVQYNSSGSFAGSANMTFDGTKLTVGNILDSGLTASKPVFTDASKNLVSTGTLGADQGGTGISTTTPYSVVFSGTTATGVFQATAGPGTATHVLTSNGAGALPTFQAPAASGVSQAKATMISFIFGF
jgi:hypothetical protein